MTRTSLACLLALTLCMADAALAVVPMQVPLQGVVRDNAGAPAMGGDYGITFTLYADAEGTTPVWSESQDVAIHGGMFRTNLGAVEALNIEVFTATAGLWLGVSVEGEPELPLRPIGATPYSLVAGDAAGLSCTGCVATSALSNATVSDLTNVAVAAVEAAGYHVAAGTGYDGDDADLDATTVQGALDELKELLDEATAGGGAITGDVNEGAGQVVAYELARGIDGGGSLKQYVHLVNPATPKVVAYIYGEQGIETLEFVNQPTKTGDLNFDTRSHGGGYSPYHDEFWYPQWSGSEIYRYNMAGGYIGSWGSGQSSIMQVWGDVDGSYYTANWGNDRVYKWAGMNDNSQPWNYHLGSTAGGVCSDGEHVYAMRHSGQTVWKLDKDNGSLIEQFNLPNTSNNLHGGLVCLPGRLYYGSNSEVLMYDVASRTQIGSFNVCETVYNMAFDGKTMWITDNDSTLCGYELLTANLYDTSSGGEWAVDEATNTWSRKSATRGVEVWVDGVNVTASLGDPNGKGAPHWNDEDSTWGTNGLDGWSSGQLDLTNVTDWTLGEHTVELRETGGVGGELKGYVYVIYPFTESTPPVNDDCDSPVSLEIADGPVVVSGTTEDTMGKILATDTQNGGEGCSLEGGPDVTYRIDLSERSLINAAITAPFPATLYIRSGDCEQNEPVYCGQNAITTNPLDAGTYYLIVDGDSPGAKGDFTLAVSATPALLPEFDTCDTSLELIFSGQGVATHSGSTLYALDQYQGWCDAAGGGADVVYQFQAGTGQTVQIDVSNAEFDPVLHLYRGDQDNCGDAEAVSWCVSGSSLQLQGQQGGTYYLIIDGTADKQWGAYDLTVTLQ